jgi:hypothetical protein
MACRANFAGREISYDFVKKIHFICDMMSRLSNFLPSGRIEDFSSSEKRHDDFHNLKRHALQSAIKRSGGRSANIKPTWSISIERRRNRLAASPVVT